MSCANTHCLLSHIPYRMHENSTDILWYTKIMHEIVHYATITGTNRAGNTSCWNTSSYTFPNSTTVSLNSFKLIFAKKKNFFIAEIPPTFPIRSTLILSVFHPNKKLYVINPHLCPSAMVRLITVKIWEYIHYNIFENQMFRSTNVYRHAFGNVQFQNGIVPDYSTI